MLREKVMETAQKMEFSVKDFFSKYDQIRSFLRIWSYLLKKSLIGNFIVCAVQSSKTLTFQRLVSTKAAGLFKYV